jgi:hypothetical protein
MPVLLNAFHHTEAHEFYERRGFAKRVVSVTMER